MRAARRSRLSAARRALRAHRRARIASQRSTVEMPADRDELDGQLRKHFRPEFLNRIDDVVIFDPLGKHELRDIVEIQLRALQKLVIDRRLTLEVTDAAKDRLTELGHEPAFGARPLNRVILKQLQDPLAEEILRGGYAPGDTIHIDVAESGEFSFTRHAVTSPT